MMLILDSVRFHPLNLTLLNFANESQIRQINFENSVISSVPSFFIESFERQYSSTCVEKK